LIFDGETTRIIQTIRIKTQTKSDQGKSGKIIGITEITINKIPKNNLITKGNLNANLKDLSILYSILTTKYDFIKNMQYNNNNILKNKLKEIN
jgi:hypothetical protein